jgi:hypothetical protein
MKMHLGGQTFQTDDEIKGGVLHCLHSEDKSLYAAGISNLPGRWKTCVSVEGKYLENQWEFGDCGTNILFGGGGG